MEDKITQTRNYILDQLESGQLKAGDKLPGARVIAKEINVSFAKVQQAVDKLVQEGVLESRSRQGSFVQQGWQGRILQTNITAFRSSEHLLWLKGLQDFMAQEIPQLRLCQQFPNSVFEIRTTLTVQSNCNDYLDLSDVFERCYPERSLFFSHPFKTFYINNKLPGIPLIFSPRVFFFNPELLTQYGCELPAAGWTWQDFIAIIRQLKKHIPTSKIYHWSPFSHHWINYVFRAGGCLLDFEADDPVKIDDPKTVQGLELFAELRDELQVQQQDEEYVKEFTSGNAAFLLGAREVLPSFTTAGFSSWESVPLPMIDGGSDVTAQATDLICVRKSCTDPGLIEKVVKLMLSEKLQDYLAEQKYGIPIRKTSAFKSIDVEDPRDVLFLNEGAKIRADYNLNSPELCNMISNGISQMLMNNDDIKTGTAELASAVRTFLRIKCQDPNFKLT